MPRNATLTDATISGATRAYVGGEFDIFAAGGPPAEHLARHPFGKIPEFKYCAVKLAPAR